MRLPGKPLLVGGLSLDKVSKSEFFELIGGPTVELFSPDPLLLVFFVLETILAVGLFDKISSLRNRKMGRLTTVALLTGLEPASSWKINK